MITNEEIATIARPEGMHARAYTDPQIFDLEMERIFGRVWVFLGHESQLAKPGDFWQSQIGTNEVLLVRQRDYSIKTLFNSCSHRGTRLCNTRSGNVKSFICPYHAWAFDLNGQIKSVPDPTAYPYSFKNADLNLRSAQRVSSYRGFIFASLSLEGPSLEEFLGPMADAIDNLIQRSPDEQISIEGGYFRVRYRGNWKLHHENANDVVHPSFVHESSVNSARQSDGSQGYPTNPLDKDQQVRGMMVANGLTPSDWNSIELNGCKEGHSFMGGFYKSGLLSPGFGDDTSIAYQKALEKVKGKQKTSEILAMDRFNNLIWPSLNINAQFHQIRVVRPISVNETIIEGYCFRLKGAPEEIFFRAIRFLNTLVSPASTIFTDDIEIFERVQEGLENGDLEYLNSCRGLDTDKPLKGTNNLRSNTSSELPLRVQASAWKHWMSLEL